MMAVTGFLVWFLILPCSAFVKGGSIGSSPIVPWSAPNVKSGFTLPPALKVRGGYETTSLKAASDFSGAARTLFGNVVSPAALLAGGLVPLGFLAPPLSDDKPLYKKLKKIYQVLAVLSLANELTAIVYATVASNKLTEISLAPAVSVFALIKRDFQLEWVATNVHFLLGLFGYLSLVMLRAFVLFPANLKVPCAGFAASALLLMCNIVNRGVQEGDGSGSNLAQSMVYLLARYAVLLGRLLRKSGGIALGASLILGAVSSVLAIKALLEPEKED